MREIAWSPKSLRAEDKPLRVYAFEEVAERRSRLGKSVKERSRFDIS